MTPETSSNPANGIGDAGGTPCPECGNCFAWERIEQAWGLCAVDDVETRVDDLCAEYVPYTPPEAS